jgi:hypothetical protein
VAVRLPAEGCARAVVALNVEDLDLPNKQARITAKGAR